MYKTRHKLIGIQVMLIIVIIRFTYLSIDNSSSTVHLKVSLYTTKKFKQFRLCVCFIVTCIRAYVAHGPGDTALYKCL